MCTFYEKKIMQENRKIRTFQVQTTEMRNVKPFLLQTLTCIHITLESLYCVMIFFSSVEHIAAVS